MNITLRNIIDADRELLFKWRNDPYIIDRSSSRREVTCGEHNSWFSQLLNDNNTLAFIAEINEQSAGHIRFEYKVNHCVITVYLMPENTGKGYGIEIIRLGCEAAIKKWPSIHIVAHVREDNIVAQSGFVKADFRLATIECPVGHVAMMLKDDGEEIKTAKRYSELFQSHGLSHLALDWGSVEGQKLRFKILSEIADLNGKKILDVGCGLADFSCWLTENSIKVEYTGLDITTEIVKECQRIYPDLKFINGSILDESLCLEQKFDFVFASGIFATYKNGGLSHMEECLNKMWSLAEKGIAFNTLSTWSENMEINEFYADPAEVINLVRKISCRVVLRHDYHPRDLTVYALKETCN